MKTYFKKKKKIVTNIMKLKCVSVIAYKAIYKAFISHKNR